MAGRRAAVDGGVVERTPWEERQLAARQLGKIRRVISDNAMMGDLPDVEQRREYIAAQERLDTTQAAWLASRGAGSAR